MKAIFIMYCIKHKNALERASLPLGKKTHTCTASCKFTAVCIMTIIFLEPIMIDHAYAKHANFTINGDMILLTSLGCL